MQRKSANITTSGYMWKVQVCTYTAQLHGTHLTADLVSGGEKINEDDS